MREGVGGRFAIMVPDLPSRNGAILVQCKWHNALQIAQWNVPLSGGLAGIDRQAEIAFARFVRARAKGEKETNQRGEPDARLETNWTVTVHASIIAIIDEYWKRTARGKGRWDRKDPDSHDWPRSVTPLHPHRVESVTERRQETCGQGPHLFHGG